MGTRRLPDPISDTSHRWLDSVIPQVFPNLKDPAILPVGSCQPHPWHGQGEGAAGRAGPLSSAPPAAPALPREGEPAHLPINDAFALQEEEPDGYFGCVESERGGLKERLIIKGDKGKPSQ